MWDGSRRPSAGAGARAEQQQVGEQQHYEQQGQDGGPLEEELGLSLSPPLQQSSMPVARKLSTTRPTAHGGVGGGIGKVGVIAGAAGSAATLALRQQLLAADERHGHDSQTILELRAVVDALRARLDSMEAMMQHVNVDYTIQTQRQLQDSFASIHSRLEHLDEQLLTESQKAVSAATLIGAAIRGFVARVRFRRAHAALAGWRRRALGTTARLLTGWLLRQRYIGSRVGEIESRKQHKLLLAVTGAWRAYTLGNLPARGELAETLRARRHYDWRLARASLSGWQRVVRRVRIAGIKYVFRANKRVAMRDSEVAILSSHIVAWRQVTTALLEVERRYAAVMREIASRSLHALRQWISRARALRLIALERWVELMKRRSELPFRAWLLHTVDRKIVRRAQESLTTSFRRRQQRAFLLRILGLWFDLAVLKRVEVRTRSQLIQALQEQEEANMMLEENMKE
jgi:hypothetical protein